MNRDGGDAARLEETAMEKQTTGGRGALLAAVAGVLALALAAPAAAEADEVRLVRQFGIHYLPLIVMEHEKLVEKEAASRGVKDVKVTWAQLSGGASVNDALLAGAVDYSAGGTGPLIVLWDKTRGGKGDVKAVAAVSDVPMTLVTREARVKTLSDFTDNDKIALPAVKTSMQAVTLQMAAAKLWGDASFERLDKLTVSMRHPDAAAAMLSGKSEINAHFTAAPYDFLELRDPSMRRVLDSYDVYGGPATLIVLYCTQKFYDANPKLNASVVAAMADADALIKSDPKRAAEIYLAVTKEKTSVQDLVAMITDPKINFKLAPSATFPVVKFLHRTGRVKSDASSWKDLFFPSAHELPGS
jgi:NitT/TauT family transport system substrate-binding protein